MRPERGRRPDPAEQVRHRAVPQQVHVLDAVRPGGHARDQARDLQLRVDPARPAGPDMLSDQAREPSPLRQCHYRDQPGPRHQMRVIEGCVRAGRAMQQSHHRI